ncbi:Eco47II family restriction endonuclease [Bathymodiolus platifrons methanotrophic gill symbiont]|uniref:Eco47II family restriction endonuclease n=1 Tax=Bathymodiolus platifrons methanotrophic gill symbiont TaxID=113268 RepID=UPI0030B82E4F
MLVEVIAKYSQDIVWKMRLDSVSVSDDRIRRVSIDKFYKLVTGDAHARCKSWKRSLSEVKIFSP